MKHLHYYKNDIEKLLMTVIWGGFLCAWFSTPFLVDMKMIGLLAVMLALVILFFKISQCLRIILINQYLFVFIYFLMCFFVLNTLYISGGYFTFATILGTLTIGYYTSKYSSKWMLWICNFILILFGGYVILMLQILKLPAIFLFPEVSTNTVSAVAIIISSLAYLLEYLLHKYFSLWQALLTAYLSLITPSVSRTGFFVSVLLVFVIVFNRIRNMKNHKIWQFIVLFFGSLSLILFLIYNPSFIADKVQQFYETRESSGNNVNGGLFSSPRWGMWLEYIDNLNFVEFLIGKNLDTYKETYFMQHHGNLHSAFFAMHARAGFSVFIFLLTILYIGFYVFKNRKKQIALFLVFCLALLRGATDRLFFFYLNDFVIWAYLFTFISEMRNNNIFIKPSNRVHNVIGEYSNEK